MCSELEKLNQNLNLALNEKAHLEQDSLQCKQQQDSTIKQLMDELQVLRVEQIDSKNEYSRLKISSDETRNTLENKVKFLNRKHIFKFCDTYF